MKKLSKDPKGFFSFLKNAHQGIKELLVKDKEVQASEMAHTSTQVEFGHNEPCCLPWHHAAKNIESKSQLLIYHSDILPGMGI
mmetsp:Transcript_29468/g.44692  ORF Transcript_29468/g.44692 Transcript_29468/m.44692 type:complete len:83 (-) Transcript_29468:90-338(-)